MQAFYDGCNEAGPDNCLFYASSSSEVTAKLDALTSSIKEQPIPVVAPDSHGVVDFTLRNAILAALFSPYDPGVGFVPPPGPRSARQWQRDGALRSDPNADIRMPDVTAAVPSE
ncbi:hypothetical protein K438DRAFT_836414 [Mycena galopus ATCC 62051]|nr:hypothetical protein K438DRAFT_836414 [Mycena galopus ATCC 62051]